MSDSDQREVRRGTRGVMVGMLGVAVVVIAGMMFCMFYPGPKLPRTATGPAFESSKQVTGRSVPAQDNAQSGVAKNDPAGLEDASGGRARNIKQSSEALQLTADQRAQVRDIIEKQNVPRQQNSNFELMIGSAVPAQTNLRDIPPEVTEIMNGFWGDQYVLIQDKLVIVDKNSRRVAAIVSDVAS